MKISAIIRFPKRYFPRGSSNSTLAPKQKTTSLNQHLQQAKMNQDELMRLQAVEMQR